MKDLRIRVFDGEVFILSKTFKSREEAERQRIIRQRRLGEAKVRVTKSWRGYSLWQAWERVKPN